jgi:SAM-dependent methyltransferase
MAAKRARPRAAKSSPKAPAKRAPPQEQMLGLLTGFWVSQMLFAVVKLGVPDALGAKASTAETLAARVGANAAYLRRVLRALASVGVLAEDARGRFKLTALGKTLRTGPGSMRDFALMIVAPYNTRSWERLGDALVRGETAFDLAFGVPIFEYLRAHPEDDRQFSASMASISATENDAVARAYPFGKHRRLVDVGGAHGHLLAAILRRSKKLRGVLYDQPQVVAAAHASGFVSAPGVRERCEVAGGSFFDGVPAGADAYLMKYIVHDWDDAKCERILRHCRDAMAPGGRVLVVDRVIAPGNDPDWSKWLDINMLVGPGGQERTLAEFAALFARAGLRLVKAHPTRSPLTVLEAERG